ncbi:MAG: hypothetical protein ABSG52_07485 [Terriglobales bacterium]|jgi:hypothetical protein
MSAVEAEPALSEVEGGFSRRGSGQKKGAGWFTVALAFYHHRQFD